MTEYRDIDYSTAPNQNMIPAIKRYVEDRILPGNFLVALFSDELHNTIRHADETNYPLIGEWGKWVWNEMPLIMSGSRQNVAAHVAGINSMRRIRNA